MAKTIKEWKKYYTPLPQTLCGTLAEKVARKTCHDVQKICGLAEQLQADVESWKERYIEAVNDLKKQIKQLQAKNKDLGEKLNEVRTFNVELGLQAVEALMERDSVHAENKRLKETITNAMPFVLDKP